MEKVIIENYVKFLACWTLNVELIILENSIIKLMDSDIIENKFEKYKTV